MNGEQHSRLLAYLPANVVAAANSTYRHDFASVLGISADDEFPIVACPSGFVFAGWLPPDDFLRRLYEEVIDHSKTITETIEYRRALLEFGGAFLQTIQRHTVGHTRPLRLLDFGCGYGALTQMLRGRDIDVYGYEPSAERGARASECQLTVLGSLDEVAEMGPFDLVVCTEVLEHVPDPRGVLKFIRTHMRSCALLAITVPQCESAFIGDSISAFLRDRLLPRVINPWEHLNYFPTQSLRALLLEEGFRVVKDFGCVKQTYDACLDIGDVVTARSYARSRLRLMKRVFGTKQSTELICECA